MQCVVQTKSGLGAVAERHLKQQEFDAWLPRIRDERGSLVPLFPRYLFVVVGDTSPADWRAVNGTKGVDKLLPLHLEKPGRLREDYMRDLRDRVDQMQTIESALEVTYSYVEGESVRIECGPYAGYVGTFQQKRKGVAKLLMCLLGGQSVVSVPLQNTSHTR
jgi:transcription antitermination factor NusG